MLYKRNISVKKYPCWPYIVVLKKKYTHVYIIISLSFQFIFALFVHTNAHLSNGVNDVKVFSTKFGKTITKLVLIELVVIEVFLLSSTLREQLKIIILINERNQR